MSDSEDDSDGNNGSQNNKNSETSRNEDGQNNKKVNGANKLTKEDEIEEGEDENEDTQRDNTSTNIHHRYHHQNQSTTLSRNPKQRSVRNSQKPKTSAALSVINATETILPQANSPTNEYLQQSPSQQDLPAIHHRSDENRIISSDSSESNSSNTDEKPHRYSCTRSPKKRPCEDQQQQQENEENSSNHNHLENISATSSSSSSSSTSSCTLFTLGQNRQNATASPFLSSPLKKRKLSLNDYIHVRRDSNDLAELEENNNETNNNDIFTTMEAETVLNGNDGSVQTTPQRPSLNNSTNMSVYLNNMNQSSYLFTPDSGVSLNNSLTTPSTIDQNDTMYASTVASTSRSSRFVVAHRLSPCIEGENDDNADNCNDDADDIENDVDGGRVIALKTQKYQQKMSRYEQKLARVRRNYRKQFVDDTESE